MRISLAYSPDTDDAFMVYALKEKHIAQRGYEFDYVSEDIQTLNRLARDGVYDISAVSVAAYPDISDTYALMPVGASIGSNFGPAIVVDEISKIKSLQQLKGARVAVPGLKTSAYFAASILLDNFVPVELPFHEIGPAVINGSVDAGILIHELQLNFAQFGMRKLSDLGSLWQERFRLPLPLGANVIKRSLGVERMRDLNDLYKESIEWGLRHREFAIREASKRAFQGLGDQLADRYITMYVNENSLELNDDVQKAIDILLNEASARGLCRSATAATAWV